MSSVSMSRWIRLSWSDTLDLDADLVRAVLEHHVIAARCPDGRDRWAGRALLPRSARLSLISSTLQSNQDSVDFASGALWSLPFLAVGAELLADRVPDVAAAVAKARPAWSGWPVSGLTPSVMIPPSQLLSVRIFSALACPDFSRR
jgi:hypothetical protein